MRGAAQGQTKEQLFEKVKEVCQSLHKVTKAPERIGTRGTTEYKTAVMPCRLNPLCLLCTCKGFKHHAICSHVLAISHVLKGINIREELKPLSKTREAHRPKKARGALSMQPDDGVDVEDEGDGEEFDEDLEME